MTIDIEDIGKINADEVGDCDSFLAYNYADVGHKGHVRAISFDELCKAIGRRLVKDGAIPSGDEG